MPLYELTYWNLFDPNLTDEDIKERDQIAIFMAAMGMNTEYEDIPYEVIRQLHCQPGESSEDRFRRVGKWIREGQQILRDQKSWAEQEEKRLQEDKDLFLEAWGDIPYVVKIFEEG